MKIDEKIIKQIYDELKLQQQCIDLEDALQISKELTDWIEELGLDK